MNMDVMTNILILKRIGMILIYELRKYNISLPPPPTNCRLIILYNREYGVAVW